MVDRPANDFFERRAKLRGTLCTATDRNCSTCSAGTSPRDGAIRTDGDRRADGLTAPPEDAGRSDGTRADRAGQEVLPDSRGTPHRRHLTDPRDPPGHAGPLTPRGTAGPRRTQGAGGFGRRGIENQFRTPGAAPWTSTMGTPGRPDPVPRQDGHQGTGPIESPDLDVRFVSAFFLRVPVNRPVIARAPIAFDARPGSRRSRPAGTPAQ